MPVTFIVDVTNNRIKPPESRHEEFTVMPHPNGFMIDGVMIKSNRHEYIIDKRIDGATKEELAMYERFSGVRAVVIGMNNLKIYYERGKTDHKIKLPVKIKCLDKYADSLEITLGTQEVKAQVRYVDFKKLVCMGLKLKKIHGPPGILRIYEKLGISKQCALEEFKRLYSLASLKSESDTA